MTNRDCTATDLLSNKTRSARGIRIRIEGSLRLVVHADGGWRAPVALEVQGSVYWPICEWTDVYTARCERKPSGSAPGPELRSGSTSVLDGGRNYFRDLPTPQRQVRTIVSNPGLCCIAIS